MTKPMATSHFDGIQNVLRVYDQVDAIDREEGMVAYARYRESMVYYSNYYHVRLARVVAAFCALSPNNDYMGNLRSLVTLLEGRRAGLSEVHCTVSTYKACRARAWRFLHGEDFLEVTKGPKTRNFYMNIMDPQERFPVTIDGHMVCVWVGQRMSMKEVVRTGFKYNVVASGLRAAADDLGLIPNQLQAMLWFTWKRINRIVYQGDQLDVFALGNQWGTRIDPAAIQPFTIG